MSDTEETNERELDSDATAAHPKEATENAAEKSERKEPSTPAPAEKKAILYGTRKRRPGASNASTAKTLDQIRGAYNEDEEIEMDDLVIKATAPSHLVGGEKPAPSNRRERYERPETEKEQSSEENAIDPNIEAYPEDEPSESTHAVEDNRPERFATLKENQRPERRPVEEFRPSTDGKRAAPKKRVRSEDRPSHPSNQPKKKGFFAWLKSLFTNDEEANKQEERRPSNRGPNKRRRRQDGQERGRGDRSERPNRPRGGRNRSRGPRSNAEGRSGEGRPPREGGNRRREGGNRNREGGNREGGERRRRRPQGERRESPNE